MVGERNQIGQMGRTSQEMGKINRDIVETRHEIDEHLAELSGRVRGEFNVEAQARRNMPTLLAGAAAVGLVAGLITGGRHEKPHVEREYRRVAAEYDIP